MIKSIKQWIKKSEPLYYFFKYLKYYICAIVPPKLLISYLWKKKQNKKLNLSNPQTFNEKIQWLKLNWRSSLVTLCSDKISVRNYVKEKIGEVYLNEIIFIFDKIEDIEWEQLPQRFVLKLSHDSGSVIIVEDKSSVNRESFFRKIRYHYKTNYGKLTKEWGYINVKPKIIIEKYLGYLKDYKVFCFYGVPKMIQVDLDRFTKHTRNLYTPNWQWIDLSILYPKNPSKIEEKPSCLDEILRLSSILSEPFPNVRVDWYIIDNRPKFGELTFYHGSGFEPFDNENWEYIMGSWIDLEKVKEI